MKKFCMLLLVMCLLSAAIAEFEDGTAICDKCTCLVANTTGTVLGYDILDCSRRNLHYMFDNWPDRFDTTNAEREIVCSLSGNDIVELQQLPATNAALVFSCRHCKLETLASGLFLDTPNILRVDFGWNKLDGDMLTADIFRGQYREEEHGASLSLDVLDLRNNIITHLHDDAFKYISGLRHLSLSNNVLGRISESTATALKTLVHLEYLDLSYASLTDIDSEVFVEMHALKELFIEGNKFTAIPDAVFYTTSLTSLNLGENPIATFNIMKPLENLHYLNFSSMPVLTNIQIESFKNVHSLRSLTSRNNTELGVFDLQILNHLIHLQELDLAESNLKHLTPSTNAYNNSSVANSMSTTRYPNKLEKLRLEKNPWHCDCGLQQVLQQVGFEVPIEDDSRCETPNMLVSLHLSDLTHIEVCDLLFDDSPKTAIYEKPAFLRPRAIFLTLMSVGIVLSAGILIGLIIVCLKRRLKKDSIGFTSPVRYTSVRESKTSNVYQL